MNYQDNKNPIVPSINDTPSLLKFVKDKLNARTSGQTPFFLMPVRLETRFMKGINRIFFEEASSDVFTHILKETGLTLTDTIGNYGEYDGFNSTTAIAAAIEINQLVDNWYNAVQTLSSINPAEKKYLSNHINNAISLFENTSVWLQQNCTDTNLTNDLFDVLSDVSGNLQQTENYISTISINSDWTSNVSSDAINFSTQLNNIIQDNGGYINAFFPEPNEFSESEFESFLASTKSLLEIIDEFKSIVITDADGSEGVTPDYNNLYLWTFVDQVETQIKEVETVIANLQNIDPQTLEEYSTDILILKKELRFAWIDLVKPGLLPKTWLRPLFNENELTEDEINSIEPAVTNLGNQVQMEIENLNLKFQEIIEQEGEWDDDLLSQFNGSLENIKSQIFNLQQTDSLSLRYIWNIISPINEYVLGVSDYIKLQDWEPQIIDDKLQAVNSFAAKIARVWEDKAYPAGDVTTVFSSTDDFDELRIRVYPDDIFIHTHEEKLTQSEETAGKEYWNAVFSAYGDPKKLLDAWKKLVDLFGAERAAWIAKALTPTNGSGTGGGGGGGGTTTSASAFYSAVQQAQLLTKYTTQLQSVEWDLSVPASAQSHIDFYIPQYQHLYNVVSTIESLPATFKDELSARVLETNDSFTDFTSGILTAFNDELVIDAEFEFQMSQIGGAINNIQSAQSWGAVYSGVPSFPTVQIKDDDWSESPKSYVMPDRFIYVLINDNGNGGYQFKHVKVGRRITSPLVVGFNPKPAANQPSFGSTAINNLLINDPNIKWIYDFEVAIAQGMAEAVALTKQEKVEGFNKVLVLGLKLHEESSINETTLKSNGKSLLQQLLDNHHYTNGLGILQLGTPTNNTDNSNAGYNEPDPYAEKSFNKEVWYPLYSPVTGGGKLLRKDGQWLADALGIDYSIFYHIENAGLSQIGNAMAMNRALYKGTIGNFMAEMMTPLFTEDNIIRTKRFFTDNVLGRGALPSIRVGSQPYGILPTSSFSRWGVTWKMNIGVAIPDETRPKEMHDYYKNNFGSDLFEDRFNLRMKFVLDKLTSTWLEMAATHVKNVDNNPNQQDFMQILGADATMAEVYSRFMTNDFSFYDIDEYIGAKNEIINPSYPGSSNQHHYTHISTKWNTGGNQGAPSPVSPNIPQSFLSLFDNFSISSNGPDQGLWDVFIPPYIEVGSNPSTYISQAEVAIEKILRVFQTQLISKNYILRGPTVDEKKLSEINTITPLKGMSYIQWMLDAPTLNEIWRNNLFGAMYSRSLLFLLMRQSYLLTYRDVAWDNLVKLGVFNKETRSIIGTPEGIKYQFNINPDQAILTKWHLLFNSINDINNSSTTVGQNLSAIFNSFTTYAGNTQPSFTTQPLSGIAAKSFDYILKHPQQYSSLINMQDIDEIRDAFNRLKLCSTAELDRLMREHIDLCSYRLDAWNHGLVNERLWNNRKINTFTRKAGIYLGAYGWLVDVKPVGKKEMNKQHIPANLTDSTNPTFVSSGNLGYIHTPSVAHALTAALLRCGYVSERDSADNRFAVQLSSERVKVAMSLIEGIQNGQSIAAVLGYEFERGLHERHQPANYDAYIYDFRRKFPLVPELAESNATSTNPVRLSNVVDGIALLNHVKAATKSLIDQNPKSSLWDFYQSNSLTGLDIFGISALKPVALSPLFEAMVIETDRLANAVDALGDLMVAEGIFQIAKGNTARSAAVLESITEGKTPPEIEVINTPRTGINLTNRLVAAVESVTNANSVWASSSTPTPRALAEPSLNLWVGNMLAAPFDSNVVTVSDFPEHVGCKVSFKDETDTVQEMDVLLSDLGLQPIDLVYMVQPGEYKQELMVRIAYYVRKNSGNLYSASYTGIPEKVQLTIALKEAGTVNTTATISFIQILSLLTSINQLITSSRHLQVKDFINTHDVTTVTTGSLVNLFELENRLGEYTANDFAKYSNAVFRVFELLMNSFNSIAATNDTQLSDLRQKLLMAAGFGIDFAMPLSAAEAFATGGIPIGNYAVEMLATAQKVKEEINRRYNEAVSILTSIPNGMPVDRQAEKYTEAAAVVFGSNFKVLPLFNFSYYPSLKTIIDDQFAKAVPTHPAHATDSILRHYTTQGKDIAESIGDWLYGIARVQGNVDCIETIQMLCSDANTHPLSGILPVQLPHNVISSVADYWLGDAYPASYKPSGDKLSVAVFSPGVLSNTTTNYCGLVIDEWVEQIPVKEEMSAITFHYDQPSAKPPQNVLLAVSPHGPSYEGNYNSWQLDDLIYTLLDTMDMAKVRMVEPDHFTGSGKFEIFKWVLPAIVGEVTPHEVNDSVVNGQTKYTHASYRGKMDSVQQVSFEYNVNNNAGPLNPDLWTDPQQAGGPSAIMVMNNMDDIDSDALLGDETLQAAINNETILTELTNTQNELINNLLNS